MTAPQNVPRCVTEVISLLGCLEITPVSTVHRSGENAPLPTSTKANAGKFVPPHHQKVRGQYLGPGQSVHLPLSNCYNVPLFPPPIYIHQMDIPCW